MTGRAARSAITALLAITASWQGFAQSNDPRLITGEDGALIFWQEQDIELPPFPREASLHAIPAPTGSAHSYLIDETSLTLGSDEVLRYTVVIRSESGAMNVFYEGLQCETREYKTYAFGSSEATFQRLDDSAWQRISRSGVMGYRWHFADGFACDESHGPIPAERVAARLRSGGGPASIGPVLGHGGAR